jgi:hypothetical protein
VRDVDRGDAELALQVAAARRAFPPAGRASRFEQRLVEQQHLRLDHDGARERDALLLPTGELGRPAVGEGASPTSSSGVRDLALDLARRGLRRSSPNATFCERSCAAHSA